MSKLPKGFSSISSIKADYDAFEKLVEKTYGQPFAFVGDQECRNDSSTEFSGMVKGEEIDEYDTDKLQAFKDTGDHDFLAGVLLQDMVNNDVLPEGNYIVRVCW